MIIHGYKGKRVVAYYFNRIIFNTYLTEQERLIITLLDMMRNDACNTPEYLPHFSEKPSGDYSTEDCNSPLLYLRWYANIMALRNRTTECYAEEFKDDPERALSDLKATLKELTPKLFYDDVISDIANKKEMLQRKDQRLTRVTLEHICEPMLLAMERGDHTDYRAKAIAMIARKQRAITKYAKELNGIE